MCKAYLSFYLGSSCCLHLRSDVSNLPCGLNGALYFVAMDADGGMAKYSTNKAGAKFGTGYCDSQCPRDLKFINGQVRLHSDFDEQKWAWLTIIG